MLNKNVFIYSLYSKLEPISFKANKVIIIINNQSSKKNLKLIKKVDLTDFIKNISPKKILAITIIKK